MSSSRSEFLVKKTRGECDNSFFHFSSSKEFQTFFVATSNGGNGENKEDARKRNMVTWIGICLDIWKMIHVNLKPRKRRWLIIPQPDEG